MSYKADRRSRQLKRTQKGSEGEPTGCGYPAVNGMSPEILYLSDSAQGLCILEGNTARRASGKLRVETRGRSPATANGEATPESTESTRLPELGNVQ